MSNSTVNDAMTVHGTDPQFLIEKIIRTRIYEAMYWKEACFGLTAETLIERAVELQSIGGQFANQRPTEFLCLTLKLLQLQPSKDIIFEFISNEDFKYLRALAALYLRLVGTPVEIYQHLEPLLEDYRKLRSRSLAGDFFITHMDEFVDELLREERVCDIILPRIPKRYLLEENDELPPRISTLEEELESSASESDDDNSIGSDSSDSTARQSSRPAIKERGRSWSRSSSRTRSMSSSRSPRRSVSYRRRRSRTRSSSRSSR